MAKPLDARIAAALSADARAATVADLLLELTAQIDDAQAEHDRLDGISKSAIATEDEAEQAADQVAKLARRMVRLEAKRDQLKTRHDELLASDRRKAALDRHAAAKQRRDALVADLQADMPRILNELVDYLDRIKASDAECQGLGEPGYGLERLESAEALARGCGGNFYHGQMPVPRLTGIKIPEFDASSGARLAWPPRDNSAAEVMSQVQAEARRRSEQKAARERETKNYQITPPDHPGFAVSIETQSGVRRITSQPVIALLTPYQVELAEGFGLKVEPAPAGKTMGMPQSGAFLS
ncbi:MULTISPECIES: hypothetical protein [Pseudomonadota]|uniref:hypothetical protein n=1 Tax=Pseudomonadota TaxID=1224 RepID=UPI000769BC70|nr:MULTISPECIES: hypothetical protein [Pseudomonadota]